MPPELLLIPPLLLVAFIIGIIGMLILGLILFAVGYDRSAVRAEGLYLVAVGLLYVVGYLIPILLALTLPDKGSNSAYIASLVIASLSALVIAGAAWAFRQEDPAFLKPQYAALFGFVLFFLINFGYYISVTQFARYSNIGLSEFHSIAFFDRASEQLPYLSFLLAPPGVAVAWFINSLLTQNPWSADKLVRVNLWALWAVQSILIVLVVLIRAQKMNSPAFGLEYAVSGFSATQLRDYYYVVSDFRADLFFISCHDLLVVVALTVGVIAMTAKERLNNYRNTIFIGGAVLAVMLAFLPFYVGQKNSLDLFSNVPSAETYLEKESRRHEFMTARPLYPNSTVSKHLLISLTAGGILSLSFNLPGIKLSVGG